MLNCLTVKLLNINHIGTVEHIEKHIGSIVLPMCPMILCGEKSMSNCSLAGYNKLPAFQYIEPIFQDSDIHTRRKTFYI